MLLAMNADDVLSLYRQSGALLEGHFRLTSGLHSPGYLQSALVLQHPVHAEALGRALADRLRAARPTAVLSPALGGLIIGHEVARALGVRAIFAERVDGKLTLRRGFSLAPADRVVVVEDVVTTGGSTRETIDVAPDAGAHGRRRRVDHRSQRRRRRTWARRSSRWSPCRSPTYDPASCPLCQAGRRPAVKPGLERTDEPARRGASRTDAANRSS